MGCHHKAGYMCSPGRKSTCVGRGPSVPSHRPNQAFHLPATTRRPIISRPFLGRVEKNYGVRDSNPPLLLFGYGRQLLYPLTNAVPTVQRVRLICTGDANVYIQQLLRQERPCVQKKKNLAVSRRHYYYGQVVTIAFQAGGEKCQEVHRGN